MYYHCFPGRFQVHLHHILCSRQGPQHHCSRLLRPPTVKDQKKHNLRYFHQRYCLRVEKVLLTALKAFTHWCLIEDTANLTKTW